MSRRPNVPAAGRSCPNPSCSNPAIEDLDDKRICTNCGTVVNESFIVSEITFGESSSGAAVVQGSYVGADQNHARSSGPFRKQSSAESREQVIAGGRRKLNQLASALSIHDRFVDTAARYFTLAVTHNFIQGRRTQHVVACCLYIACRQDRSAHMLIDFSDVLQINVFQLGATYLKLVKTLHLNIPQLDPELWVRRFAKHLEFGDKTQNVCRDAIRIVQRMDRDWIMEGRRPSGVCGAALLIAARMNNFRRTVTEIVYVVKVANMTVNKRLEEFKSTKSSELTVAEFRNIWLERFHDPPSFGEKPKKRKRKVRKVNDDGEVILDDDENNENEQQIEQETQSGANPHTTQESNQHNSSTNQGRVDADGFAIPDIPLAIDPAILAEEQNITDTSVSQDTTGTPGTQTNSTTEEANDVTDQDTTEDLLMFDVQIEKEILDLIDSPETLAAVEELRRARIIHLRNLPQKEVRNDPENLSDVDDDEIESVMMTEEEVATKTKIWYEYNREYVLNQEAKRLKLEADEKNGTGKKVTKRRGKHKPRDSSFPDMPSSPAEAAKEMLKKKTFSRKINYAALDSLFEEPASKTP